MSDKLEGEEEIEIKIKNKAQRESTGIELMRKGTISWFKHKAFFVSWGLIISLLSES